MPGNTTKKYVSIICKYQQLFHWYIYGKYGQHDMSNLPISYSTKTWSNLSTFMIALLDIYFKLYIFVWAVK